MKEVLAGDRVLVSGAKGYEDFEGKVLIVTDTSPAKAGVESDEGHIVIVSVALLTVL